MGRFGKHIVVVILLAAVAASFLSGLFDHLNLAELKERRSELQALAVQKPLLFSSVYFLLYLAVTGLSLPGAAVLTLAGGALFGFARGLLLVSFASSLGASLAFLVSRYLFRDWVELKFGGAFRKVREGFEKDGAAYLAFLRLVPAFPFFLVNLVTGLTRIPLWKFYLVSQIAMLPGTAVFVNAGTELARVSAFGDILSPGLIFAFALLGVFPLATKRAAAFWRGNHVPAGK